MRRNFLKKVIAIAIVTISISTINPVTANAEWIKYKESQWNWKENGVNYVGWKLIGGKWYHFNESGIMSTGWIKDSGKWYNLSDDGSMNIGWLKDKEGKWYNLSESGAMNTGWLKDKDGKWYNLSQSGTMNTGWINENDKWYYTNSSGAMGIGDIELDGKIYTFSENGALINSRDASSNKETDLKQTSFEKNSDVNRVESTEVRKAYVATESNPLNVRSQASASAQILGTLSRGTEIMVTDNQVDGFFHILSNGLDGWVSSAWVSFDEPKASIKNQTDSGINLNENTDNDLDENNNNIVNGILKSTRTVAPEANNPCYYSDKNVFYKVKLAPPFSSGGNCTWYAWGRIWEITGKAPIDAGFTGNAYEWWGANKTIGKYKYGSTPKVGAIAVWKSSLPGSGGSGHVAVVEKIDNGKVYISESMWHGGIFKYSQIYSTDYLYGYIYIDELN